MKKKQKQAKRWDEILKRVREIEHPRVAEVGVDNGKTSKKILASHKGLFLYMVDWWQPPPAKSSYARSDASIVRKGKSYFEDTFQNCRAISNAYKGRAVILRGESAEMAENVADGSLDLVFIDADHSYDGVKHDVIAWQPKIRPGGWIGGHDYAHPDQGNVKRAVDELFGDRVVLGANRTWWVRL